MLSKSFYFPCTASLSHLRTMLPRLAASPCLPNSPITQLSPYLTRNPGKSGLHRLISFCLKCTRTSLSQLLVGAEMNDEIRSCRCDTSLVIPYSNRPSCLPLDAKKLSITRSEVQNEREKGKLRNWLLSPQPEIELVKEIPFSDAELRKENIKRAAVVHAVLGAFSFP